ncbi:MAG: 50S ribosomal protein L10 [Candidatus Moranbacteria bacterium]|nr:50S ribosomal protein L10 [Candidatus Moranbacteria bacterium]
MQTRAQKEAIVKDLTAKLKNSKAVVFSDFKGMTTKDMTILRREMRAEGLDFGVFKKTLIDIAIKDAGLSMIVNDLDGQIAVAVSGGDEVAAAKIISKFGKANENLKIVAGILGEKVISRDEVIALAKLPSKEEMLAQFVRTINAPVSGFVNALAGNIRNLVQVLKAVSDSKQG